MTTKVNKLSKDVNKKQNRRATDKLSRRKEDGEEKNELTLVAEQLKSLQKDIKTIVNKKRHWSKKSNMWMLNFKSENLRKAGYSFKNKELYIMFNTKDKATGKYNEYKYTDVSLEWWAAFTLAKSKGKHFSTAKYELVNMEKLK